MPRAAKTAKIWPGPWDRAKPTAVPRKGAEHGVARDSPGAIISGYRLAVLVAGLITVPAIGLALLGGQRGIRQAAATVQRLVGVPVLIAAARPQKDAAARPQKDAAVTDESWLDR